MKITRSVFIIATLAIPSIALARPQYLSVFNSTYHAPAGSALAKASCSTCHVGMTKNLNPYGKDVQAALKKMKAKGVTPAVLKSVENKDSDKDGKKNGAEIKKGTLPGDPKSK